MITQFQAYMDKITSLKDGSFKMVFEGQELSAQDSTALFSLRGKLGWVLFSPNELSEADIPKEPIKEFKDQKSHALRLRNTIFVLWKQHGEQGDFETFYKQEMERHINMVKEKLEPEWH